MKKKCVKSVRLVTGEKWGHAFLFDGDTGEPISWLALYAQSVQRIPDNGLAYRLSSLEQVELALMGAGWQPDMKRFKQIMGSVYAVGLERTYVRVRWVPQQVGVFGIMGIPGLTVHDALQFLTNGQFELCIRTACARGLILSQYGEVEMRRVRDGKVFAPDYARFKMEDAYVGTLYGDSGAAIHRLSKREMSMAGWIEMLGTSRVREQIYDIERIRAQILAADIPDVLVDPSP